VRTTVSFVDGQTPLLIVQTKLFTPTLKFVTPDVGSSGVVTVAPPARTVHAPDPTEAVLPARVAVAEQTVWSGPAFATVGDSSRMTATVSFVAGHTPLVIVQTKLFNPTLRFVTPDAGSAGVVTAAVPARTVHTPVPTEAVFPAKVAVVEQIVWSGPAFATVGDSSRVTVTVSIVAGQTPLLIVQTKLFAPRLRFVTPDAGSPGVVTFALPARTVQTPVPAVAVLPARVAEVAQTV
jgi:predicted RNA methylase